MAYIEDEFDYKPESLEGAIFLSEAPLSLMKEQILTQFQEPLEYRKKDVFSIFIDKYDQSFEIEAPEDEIDQLEVMRDDFISYMKDLFYEYLSVGFPNLEDLDNDEQHELIHITYRFFIKNIKRNFVNVILNYIDENKNDICSSVSRKKDITSLSLKKEITNPDDIIVIANLSDIVDMAFNVYRNGNKYEVTDFIKNCDYSDPSLESQFVYDNYMEDNITGNFIEKYIDMIDNDFRYEIESKVRSKYLKSAKKK